MRFNGPGETINNGEPSQFFDEHPMGSDVPSLEMEKQGVEGGLGKRKRIVDASDDEEYDAKKGKTKISSAPPISCCSSITTDLDLSEDEASGFSDTETETFLDFKPKEDDYPCLGADDGVPRGCIKENTLEGAYYGYLKRQDSKIWAEAKNLLEVMRKDELEEDSSTASTGTSTSILLNEDAETTNDILGERPTNATDQLLIDYDDDEEEEEEEEDTRFAADQGEGVSRTETEQNIDDVNFNGAIVAVA